MPRWIIHPLSGAVGGVVGQVEPLRLVEVPLHGRYGLFVAAAVAHLQVELGAVESRLTRGIDQAKAAAGEAGSLSRRPQRRLRGFPLLLITRKTGLSSRRESRT